MKLEDANKLTLQEACDYAVAKIVEQGARCIDGTKCLYGHNGMHCAVGWLLDEDDTDLMNYRGSIWSLVRDFGDRLPDIILEEEIVFRLLQYFHDSKGKSQREYDLRNLGDYIDTSAPQYKQWVDMV